MSSNSSSSASQQQQQQSVNINNQQQVSSQQPQQQQAAAQQQNPYFHGSTHQQHHHLLGSQQQQQQQQQSQQYHQTLHNAIGHHHMHQHQHQHQQQPPPIMQSGGATTSGLGSLGVNVASSNIVIGATQQQQQQQIKSSLSHHPHSQGGGGGGSPNNNMSASSSTNPIHSVNPLPNSSHSPQQSSSSSSAITPQQQSGNSSSGNANPLQELLSLFECPVCFEFALPPIMQCQSGHIVCSNCRPKLSCCPTCRSALGNIRNLSMEKIAYSLKFPCKYTSYGCSECMSHETKLEHEDVCEFRMYNCPCPGASCKWQGTLDQVMPHLLQQHKSITTLQGEDIVFLATDITLPGAVDWVMMQSCFGYNFMLVLEKQEKHESYPQFFAVVQLIGTRRQAERFVYKLELNGQRRRLTWEATPRSIHDGVQQAITSSDCLVFDTHTAQLFADSGNLGINVTISLN